MNGRYDGRIAVAAQERGLGWAIVETWVTAGMLSHLNSLRISSALCERVLVNQDWVDEALAQADANREAWNALFARLLKEPRERLESGIGTALSTAMDARLIEQLEQTRAEVEAAHRRKREIIEGLRRFDPTKSSTPQLRA